MMSMEKMSPKALFAAMMGANLVFLATLSAAIHFGSIALGIADLVVFYWVTWKLAVSWKKRRESRASKASLSWLLLVVPLAGIVVSQLVLGPIHFSRLILFVAACLAVVGLAMFERSMWRG